MSVVYSCKHIYIENQVYLDVEDLSQRPRVSRAREQSRWSVKKSGGINSPKGRGYPKSPKVEDILKCWGNPNSWGPVKNYANKMKNIVLMLCLKRLRPLYKMWCNSCTKFSWQHGSFATCFESCFERQTLKIIWQYVFLWRQRLEINAILRWLPIDSHKLLTPCFICTIHDQVLKTEG